MKETWGLVDKYPPHLVRLLAKRRTGAKQIAALSDEDIAIMSQIPLDRVREIYRSSEWKCSVQEMRAFCSACDFDPENSIDRNRLSAYKNQRGGPKFTYLRKSPWWSSVFKPLILEFLNDNRVHQKDASHPSQAKVYDARGGHRGQEAFKPGARPQVAIG